MQMTIAEAMQRAAAYHSAGKLSQAETICRQIIAAAPNLSQALHLIGIIGMQTGRLDVAADFIARAIAADPSRADFHSNFAAVLNARGEHVRAADVARRAIGFDPNFLAAHFNLALALQVQNQPEEAEQSYRRALAIDPKNISALNNLGGLLRSQGRISEAIECYRKAIQINPAFAGAHQNLGLALKEQNQLPEAIASIRRSIELAPSDSAFHSNLLLALHYHPLLTREHLFAEHLDWSRRHAEPLAVHVRPYASDRNPDRRLRIGYVSADFKRHAVAHFIEPVLAGHDREAVEVFCYASVIAPDEITARLRALPVEWRDVARLSDQRLVEEIRADQIDILVDLGGHTGFSRLLAFAHKPAPVQATWIGYPNTSGMRAIDWWLTDAHLDPPGQTENFCTEKLMRLPESFVCYAPPAEAPPVAEPPSRKSGFITFGCFNNVAKLAPAVVEIWARVLNSVPKSRLYLQATSLADDRTRELLAAQFAQHGIAEDRVIFQQWQPIASFLDAHRHVDILLDPFPFTGHTITLHGLWMGVPIVTLAGDSHLSRRGMSILRNLDLPDLIAASPDDYVRIATERSADTDRLAALRASMRERMRSSSLLDAPKFTRNLEHAYREMWLAWSGR